MSAALSWSASGSAILLRAHSSKPSRENVIKQLDQADSLARDGAFDRAIEKLRSFSVPGDYPVEKARLHHNLGVLLLRGGMKAEAKKHLELSLRFDPENVRGLYSLAQIALREGKYEQAKKYLETALEIDGSFGPARELRSRLERLKPGD